jgi:hypothetical protein
MLRALLKARDNGQEFAVYFTDRDDIEKAAEDLNADVLSIMQDAPEALMLFEQIDALTKAKEGK